MATNKFIFFEVHLNDEVRVKDLNENPPAPTAIEIGPPLVRYVNRAPETGAAVEFGPAGSPLPLVGPNDTVPSGEYIYSDWFTDANNFPLDVRTFVRKKGGWFGIPALFGEATRFYWVGKFVYDPPKTDQFGGTTRAFMPQRRWMTGFLGYEHPAQGTQSSNQIDTFISRDAARTPDGLGFAMRGGTEVMTRNIQDYHGSLVDDSWERMYIRLRKLGGSEMEFWRSVGNVGNESGGRLKVLPSGQISIYNSNNVATLTLLGTTEALEIDRWYKLDVLIRYATASQTGVLKLFLDNELKINASISTATGGLGQLNCRHNGSILGSNIAHTTYFDIAYWHNAHIPVRSGGTVGLITDELLNGIDFLNGSRAVLLRPMGTGASHANWTGDFTLAAQIPPRDTFAGAAGALESTTALATLALTTDSQEALNIPDTLGSACFVVHMYGHRGTTAGQLGWKINGAATDLAALSAQGAGPTKVWNSRMYRPAALGTPEVLHPAGGTAFELVHEKGNDATVARVNHLFATVELIGTFGDEDYPKNLANVPEDPRPFLGIHNAPYPATPWARSKTPPFSPVVTHSGTYVGNGTHVDLLFRAPVNWLWIRRTTAGAGVPKATRWWSSMLAPHMGAQERTLAVLNVDRRINGAYVPPPPGGPTGSGPMPTRSSEVAAIVNVPFHLAMLDGTDEGKRELARLVARELNATIPADGNNWGLLIKNDRTPPFVVTDVIVWKPTGQHVDILTDTGPTWIPHDPIPPEWAWLAVSAEGTQEQQTLVRISGADPESNENGSTYAYMAVMDPGMRFMLNRAWVNLNTGVPHVETLIKDAFLAAYIWGISEEVSTDTGVKMWIKGPGNSVDDVTDANAASQITGALTIAAGALTARSGLSIGQTYHLAAANLWRMDDGSGDPGVFNVVRILSYVGNGSSPRVIQLFGGSLPAATGKRPKWAFIVANTGGAGGMIQRDPTHNGNSTQVDNGTLVVNGITAGGPDTLTVGAALNTNGVTYNVFVLMGGTTAGNDGWDDGGEDIPVSPDIPPDWPGGDNPEPPTDDDPGGGGGDTPGDPGGGDDDIDTDLAPECLPFTKRVANRALSRIGVSKQVGDLAFEVTEEAVLVRLHYAKALEETLRDFPWPFSTRYATLALLAGSATVPVNRDWQYSYRRPSDCVFERRIVVVRNGAVDPTPPPFQLSYDNTGGRIFTNQAAAILEYTARPDCSAGRGDPLFLDAFTWKLASQLAGPLTRIADVTAMCEAQYKAALDKALEVIRPGNPGPRTTLDPSGLDVGTTCVAANVAVVNRGLIRIGARTIANLDLDQSREADAARVIFEAELRATLRDYSWGFATRYNETLQLVRGPAPSSSVQAWSSSTSYSIGDAVKQGGVVYYAIAPSVNQVPPNAAFWTTTAPDNANADWLYAYRLPTDSIKVRRIVREEYRRSYDPNPPQFRVVRDGVGKLLFTDWPDPKIEYTARIACACGQADDLFLDAFAWRLAASLAPSLAQVDAEAVEQHGRGPMDRPRERKSTEAQLRARAADAAWRGYYLALAKAKAADANEQQQDPFTGDAPWILGRE